MSLAINSVVDNGDGSVTINVTGAFPQLFVIREEDLSDSTAAWRFQLSVPGGGSATLSALTPGSYLIYAADGTTNELTTPRVFVVTNGAVSPAIEQDAVASLEAMLAASPYFQSRVGLIGAAARQKIFYPWFAGEVEPARPFVIIELTADYAWRQISGGPSNDLWPSLALHLTFADNDRQPGDLKASTLDFVGWVDHVIGDLAAASGKSGNLSITSLRRVGTPSLTRPRDAGTDVAPYWSTKWSAALASVDTGQE
jgi:hypothetical protein